MTQTIDETLAERGARYGKFEDHAAVTQNIKQAMQDSKNWDNMDCDQIECLEMIAHKIGRILNGDPYYVDSWTDIIGYTRLVEKRLVANQVAVKTFMDSREETVAAEKCDDPACPGCRSENRASLGDMLAAALGGEKRAEALATKPAKPTMADITAALNTLLAAGVINPA